MEKHARASRNYTIFGLVGGVYYRELTRHYKYEHPAPTQLRVLHTHCFALGTLFFLIVLLLERQFGLTKQRNYKTFHITYNIGLGITLMMLIAKGTLSVLGHDTKSRWLSWTAGCAHILVTVGFGFFYDVLIKAVKGAAAPK